jgi:thioredoxin reductase
MRIGIVGAGPSGVAAGIFLKRYGYEVELFEREEIGGLIKNAYKVVNIPYLQPMSGEEIVEIIKRRVKEFALSVNYTEIVEVNGTTIKDVMGRTYHFDKVLVATGTRPKRLPALEVDERVVYEFLSIPPKTKSLAVYGGGDIAFDGALKALTRGIKEVSIFVRSNNIRAVPELYSEAVEKGIKIMLNEPIICVNPTESLKIITTKREYSFDALLLAIGREPDTSIIKESKGVTVVGDAAVNKRQMSISVAHAIETCMQIVEELRK